MHSYITDSSERRSVPLLLAGMSILLSWTLYKGLASTGITIPWWIDAPSVAGFYGMLYSSFDKYLWRVKLLRKLGIVKVPILDGIWSGYVVSSFDNHSTKHSVRVQIVQNWTQLRINLESANSKSHSFIAAVLTDGESGISLNYEYQSEPLPDAKETMQIHQGTTRLILTDGRVLAGDYYSGRGRSNYGHIHLSRG